MNTYDFVSELFQFLILLPAAFLCFLPMRRQLKLKPVHTWLLVLGVLVIVIPLGAFITTVFHLSPNVLLFPLFLVFFTAYYHMVRSGLGETLAIFLQVVALMSFPADFSLAYDAKLHPDGRLADSSLSCSLFQLLLSIGFMLVFGYFLYRFESTLIDRLPRARLWYATLDRKSVV